MPYAALFPPASAIPSSCGLPTYPAMACGYSDIPIYITQTEARRAKRSHCAYHTGASQTPS